jgi:hypothetical protein
MLPKISRFTPLSVFLSALALLIGLWAGLLRLGWSLPRLSANLPLLHGPLMVCGFLGILITLERVVALQRKWMFAAPITSGLGWIVCLVFPDLILGPALVALGSLGTLVVLSFIVRREPAIYTWTMWAGSAAWLGGNLGWLFGMPIYRVVLLWIGFLLLTIAGERLELSRVLRPTPTQLRLFGLSAGLFGAGALLALVVPDLGSRLAGAGMLALAAWLVRFDIARRNLRHPLPLTRYIAFCLFGGYLWLGLGGALYLGYGLLAAGPIYDAALHSVFVGFVFAMIFGHAPIILPALFQIMLPFRKIYFLNLALLHLSLLLRVIGDLAGSDLLRLWGGLSNEIAILLFLVTTITSIRAGTVPRRKPAK